MWSGNVIWRVETNIQKVLKQNSIGFFHETKIPKNQKTKSDLVQRRIIFAKKVYF